MYWNPLPTAAAAYLRGEWDQRDRPFLRCGDRFLLDVRLLLTAAWNDPFRAYACHGDEHWTLALVREWWADADRIRRWIDDVCRKWSTSKRDDERENTLGLRDYATYFDSGLETYLREYGFWLDNQRPAMPGETLPGLKRH